MRKVRLLMAVGLVAAACTSPAQDAVAPLVAAEPGPSPTEAVAAEPADSAPAPTTTTTAVPVYVEFELTTRPVDAEIIISAADGTLHADIAPFAGQVAAGPATVTAAAEGYNAASEDIEVTAGAAELLYLDREGQLLHKITEFDTGGGPKQVAFTRDNAEVWVTLLGGSGVQIFDTYTGEMLADIDLPVSGAVEVIFNRAGTRAYVSQMETASVYEIDVATREVMRTFSTGSAWTKVMVLSPDGKTLYASNWSGNDVSEIDVKSGELVRRIPTVATPRGLYVTPEGDRLYVAGFGRGQIQVIDLATGTGDVIYGRGIAVRHLVGDRKRGVIYASDMGRDEVLVIDTVTNGVSRLAAVAEKPNTIDLAPGGRMLFVSNRGANNPETYYLPGPEWGSVIVLDTKTGAYLDAIVGGNQPTGLDVSRDGALLAFSDFLDDRVVVYEVPEFSVMAAGDGGRSEEHLTEIQK